VPNDVQNLGAVVVRNCLKPRAAAPYVNTFVRHIVRQGDILDNAVAVEHEGDIWLSEIYAREDSGANCSLLIRRRRYCVAIRRRPYCIRRRPYCVAVITRRALIGC
jgi:hypothetical protein